MHHASRYNTVRHTKCWSKHEKGARPLFFTQVVAVENEMKRKCQKRAYFFIFILVVLISSCAPKKKIEYPSQLLEEYKSKTEAADALYKAGSYTCLKESFHVYKELLGIHYDQKNTSEKLIKTAILLVLRQKELGIHDGTYSKEVLHLIQENPSLAEYSTYLDLVESMHILTKGKRWNFIDDSRKADMAREKLEENIKLWNQKLEEKSTTEEFYAFLSIAENCHFPFYLRDKQAIQKKQDFSSLLEIFPESLLIQFKLSLCPEEDIDSLRSVLRQEPRYYEIHYFLGDHALKQGLLITAEKNYLECYKHIPESVPAVISLASVYFALEELEQSLEFYDKAIAIIPELREALLGKAICLSYLNRHEEAIEVCKEVLRLGGYLPGDTHYWLAWNQNELENLDDAWKNVENSKGYLVGYSQVFSLAGVIAFKKNDRDTAEKNFIEAMKLDFDNFEASYYLGKIYAAKQEWEKSGKYYESASLCQYRREKATERKITEIENSDFSEERKNKLLSKKKFQLKKTVLTKATCFYNAAAGYFNAGRNDQALKLAEQALSHSALKEKAGELIAEIKDRN
jgi:tetratricopeptide (TPR) repeat protein